MIDFLVNLYTYKPVTFFFSIIGTIVGIFGFMRLPLLLTGVFFTRKFEKAKNNHKYAVLIPARNESAVIGNLLDSIKRQDYPSELLTVFVVADNCTDNTAQIARENGAVCYEHNNPDERTKGFGLKYLFERIEEDYGIESFEGYFIFDADNLLNTDYISRMNDSFDAGEKIITSYRNTKNFDENWISALYGLHWIRSVRTKHRARSFFRLATNIQGTGFLFANELVKNGWHYTSLTEDRAFTADSVANGYQISFNNEAIFYDEQPISFRISVRQRFRWCKGHLDAFFESGGQLFKNIFVDKATKYEGSVPKYICETLRHRLMSLDTLDQLIPKSVIDIFKWIIQEVILHSVFFAANGGQLDLFKNPGKVTSIYSATAKIFYTIFGPETQYISKGLDGWVKAFLIIVLYRILARIISYLANIPTAIYVFIIEHKRIPYFPLYKKVFYCFMWPLFDIADRYLKIPAFFTKKVEWKTIPHESKITITDIQNKSKKR